MPGKKNTPACPAQWVGGQRRKKLVRRQGANGGPPRSSTMPVLNPESAATSLVSSVSSVGTGYAKERQSEDSYDQQQREKRQGPAESDKMQFYPLNDVIESDVPYTSFEDGPVTAFPKLTAANSKKKQSLFSTKKPKALERPNNSQHIPLITSPLPLATPSKAAQFFGLEPKPRSVDSPRRGQYQDDGTSDDAAVRPPLRKQYSLPLLTRLKLGANRKTNVKAEDVEFDLSKATKTDKTGTTKGLRMLLPDFAGPKRAVIQQATAATARFDHDEEDADIGYSSDTNVHETRLGIPAVPRPVPAVPKRRMRKKSPKSLERMSPITEASVEEFKIAYHGDEDGIELDVISEYEHDDYPYSAPTLPRSRVETVMPRHGAFELDQDDLSPTEEFEEDEADGEDNMIHLSTRTEVNQVHWQQPTTMHIRSPLQTIEDDYLDATEEEMRFEARKMTLARIEAEKRAMDTEIAILKREHEKMKLEYGRVGSGECACAKAEPTPDESSDEDEDLVSLRSSIDLDEEPTLHEAKVVTFTKITPGMVKLVDIPPRKNNPVPSVEGSLLASSKSMLVGHERNDVAISALGENIPPVSPITTHYHHEDPDRITKPKKSKLTRDESRLLVQNWVSDYNNIEQRPISTRVDPDVLADQKTPPAPFPKSDEALLTSPIKPRSDSLAPPKQLQKHQCINNGHIFHPIDLKQIPDAAVVNSLEVRPYLQTYTGVKQHVKVPILCEKCGEDCEENVWECEIAVCRMVVCQSCAEDMEAEWRERAVSGWKYK